MKTYYNIESAPSIGIRYIGCGEWTCTYAIKKVEVQNGENEDETVEMYECSEVTLKEKPTFGATYTAVIRETYSEDEEYSMINSYNASKSGVNIDPSKEEEYEKFLAWKEIIKATIKPIFGSTLTLEEAKNKKIAEISNYDNSSEVNGFYYQGQKLWVDKDTRVGLVNAANASKGLGNTEITVGIGGLSVTLPIDNLLIMLYRLEMYALDCYNVTLGHKNAIKTLGTEEEVSEYNFTVGYPEMLSF